jgi:hypothetical protein
MASIEEQQLKLIADLEIEMMSDMYNRLVEINKIHKMKCTVRHAVQERFYLLLQDVSEKVQWQRV